MDTLVQDLKYGLRPLPFPAPDRLMSVWQNNRVRGWHQDVVTPLDFIDWRNTNRSFAARVDPVVALRCE